MVLSSKEQRAKASRCAKYGKYAKYDNLPTDRHVAATDPQVGAVDQRRNCLIPRVTVRAEGGTGLAEPIAAQIAFEVSWRS